MDDYGYGLWFVVVVNSLLFIVFAASFLHPQRELLQSPLADSNRRPPS